MRSTTKIAASLLASATLLAGAAAAQTAMDGGRRITTTLTGAAEVPGPGDADGSGTAVLTINPGQKRICYELTVANIEAATMAHIHEGASNVAGPVVVNLAAPSDGDSSGCADVTRELALEILKDPGDYYVNVHNTPFPGGAVRGQLAKK